MVDRHVALFRIAPKLYRASAQEIIIGIASLVEIFNIEPFFCWVEIDPAPQNKDEGRVSLLRQDEMFVQLTAALFLSLS